MQSYSTFAKTKKNFGLCSTIQQQHKVESTKETPISPEESRESELLLFKWSLQTINVDTVDKKLIPA